MGTFDLTVLTIDEGIFEVKATNGDSHLGGADIDNRLVEHFVKEFKRKHGKDITTNKRAMKRMLIASENVKKTLSSSTTSSIELDSLYDGIDFASSITRARLDELCMSLYRRTIDCIDKVLKDSGLSKSDIHEIIMVGGSSRIPRIQQMLSEYFNGKELNKSVNPDEVVAVGAGIQAAILSGSKDDAIKDLLLLDVCPLSLSIETAGGVSTVIIPRNSTIPIKRSQIFSTYADNQPAVSIKIYEGERNFCKDNILLGEFELTGIPPAQRGIPQISVSLDIDANSILQVTAEDKGTGKSHKITITAEKGRLTKEQIDKMVAEAEEHKKEDEELKAKIDAKNEFENYLYNLRNTITENKEVKLDDSDKETIKKVVDEGIEWIDNNQHATTEEFKYQLDEANKTVNPIMSKMYGSGGGGGAAGMEGFAEQFANMNAEKGPDISEID